MELSKNLKKILVTGAALLMTASVMSAGNVANARHRRYRYHTHRVYRRYARRHYRRARKHYRRRARVRRRLSHSEYAWMADGNSHNSISYYKVKIIGYTKRDDEPHVRYLNKNQIKFNKSKTGYVPVYGLFHTRAEAVRNETDTNPNVVDVSYHNGSLEDTGKKIHHRKSHHSKSHKRSHVNNTTYSKRYTNRELVDINNDREDNGLQPVQENPQMDKIAQMRAKQASQNFTHYNSNGKPYELEDAKRAGIDFGIQYGIDGPNQPANGVLGFTENLASGYTPDGANSSMMYHDQDQGNGHRKNILYVPWKYVGLGEHNGTLAEEFASWVK